MQNSRSIIPYFTSLKRSVMKILHVLRIHKIKWRHWLLLALFLLVTLTKMIPLWGFLYTTRIYPVIGKLLSPVSGIIPFAVGDIFIATSIAWVILFPIYEIGWRKKKKKGVFGKVIEYLLWVYVWFYLAWGLNYSQPNIYNRIGMKHPQRLSRRKGSPSMLICSIWSL